MVWKVGLDGCTDRSLDVKRDGYSDSEILVCFLITIRYNVSTMPQHGESANLITAGTIDCSSLTVIKIEKDFALRDVRTGKIVGFSPCKFLQAGPPYLGLRPSFLQRLRRQKPATVGTFYYRPPSEAEYSRLLAERRAQDEVCG